MTATGQISTPDNPCNSPLMKWIRDVALTYQGDDCLPWPFACSKDGYGTIGRAGKNIRVHRYICTLAHGEPPTPQHEAAHSCGLGHEGCVNQGHLSWKTRTSNQADKRIHGTGKNGHRWKLTHEQVTEIRAAKPTEVSRVTAKRFGVNESTIRQIQTGKIWRTGKRDPGGFAVTPYRGGRPSRASPSTPERTP